MTGGGHKKRFQYCSDSSGAFLYLRALQDHSRCNLIDPLLQDNVVFPSNFFQYILHVGCAINLHFIINSGLVPGRQHLNNYKIVILSVSGITWTKIIRILRSSTWRVMHNTCIQHGRNIRTQCFGSTSIVLWGKDWTSISLDRTQSVFTKHFKLIVFRKLLGWKLEKAYTRKYVRHLGPLQRSPWNVTGRENLERRCSTISGTSSQSNQSTPNPDHDRTEESVVGTNPRIESSGRKTSRSQEIETRSPHEEAVEHDRTEHPVVDTGATQTSSSDDSKSFNVEDKAAHDWTGQPVESCHLNIVPDGSQTRGQGDGVPKACVCQAAADSRGSRTCLRVCQHPLGTVWHTQEEKDGLTSCRGTVGSRVWRHTQGSSGRSASDLGWRSSSKTAPGSLSTGSPAGRTPPHGDGSMYRQVNVRAGKVLQPPIRALLSVIVDTGKMLREADGSAKSVVMKPHADGKVIAPNVRLESPTVMSWWGDWRS